MNRARLLAYQSLCRSVRLNAYANFERDEVLEAVGIEARDAALYTKLYFGVLEKKITLDFLLSHLCDRPLSTLSPELLCLLEMGLYQILYLDRIPDHAALFETVELAKKKEPGAASTVNAVLRRAVREKDALPAFLLSIPGKKGLAVRYGYPRYLVRLWTQAYGEEKCESILKAQNTPAPLTIRINTLRISREDFCRESAARGIVFHQSELCETALICDKAVFPSELYGYQEGFFYVQDAAAQQAVRALGARPGERVLDLCAAPGGKSFGAAIDMNDQGFVLSADLSEKRLNKLKNGADRLGLDSVQTLCHDGTAPLPESFLPFDRVICDVPCSGFGVIARKPDIRLKKQMESASLPALQGALLRRAAAYLRNGGVLLYATCTLNPAENEDVTNAFLAENPAFRRRSNPVTVFPVGGENDGFFYDVLEKQA